MNAKLLFKTLFLLVVLGLLVLIGKNNTGTVAFSLPPFTPKSLKASSSMMYYSFFAVGVLTGTILTAGGGGGGSIKNSGSSKPAKKDK